MGHPPISRARYLQENRKMKFEEAYDRWTQGRRTQNEAAFMLGQCERSFRRHIERYEADGLEGLLDKRLSQISKRVPAAPRLRTSYTCKKAALQAGAWRTFTANTNNNHWVCRAAMLEATAGSKPS
jgi:hypothetical protein